MRHDGAAAPAGEDPAARAQLYDDVRGLLGPDGCGREDADGPGLPGCPVGSTPLPLAP